MRQWPQDTLGIVQDRPTAGALPASDPCSGTVSGHPEAASAQPTGTVENQQPSWILAGMVVVAFLAALATFRASAARQSEQTVQAVRDADTRWQKVVADLTGMYESRIVSLEAKIGELQKTTTP